MAKTKKKASRNLQIISLWQIFHFTNDEKSQETKYANLEVFIHTTERKERVSLGEVTSSNFKVK